MKKTDHKKNKGLMISFETLSDLRKSPAYFELLELLEDREALLKAKKEGGKGITLQEYMKKRFK